MLRRALVVMSKESVRGRPRHATASTGPLILLERQAVASIERQAVASIVISIHGLRPLQLSEALLKPCLLFAVLPLPWRIERPPGAANCPRFRSTRRSLAPP